MKKMSKTVIVFMVGILVAFTIDVAAEAVISSGAVSYSNTTVSAALDELFSAVDINKKIGTTNISTIGNGTITGAISAQQNSITNLQGESLYNTGSNGSLFIKKYGNMIIVHCIGVSHKTLITTLNNYIEQYPPVHFVDSTVWFEKAMVEYLGAIVYNGTKLIFTVYNNYPANLNNASDYTTLTSSSTQYNTYGTIIWHIA